MRFSGLLRLFCEKMGVAPNCKIYRNWIAQKCVKKSQVWTGLKAHLSYPLSGVLNKPRGPDPPVHYLSYDWAMSRVTKSKITCTEGLEVASFPTHSLGHVTGRSPTPSDSTDSVTWPGINPSGSAHSRFHGIGCNFWTSYLPVCWFQNEMKIGQLTPVVWLRGMTSLSQWEGDPRSRATSNCYALKYEHGHWRQCMTFVWLRLAWSGDTAPTREQGYGTAHWPVYTKGLSSDWLMKLSRKTLTCV